MISMGYVYTAPLLRYIWPTFGLIVNWFRAIILSETHGRLRCALRGPSKAPGPTTWLG